MKKIIKYTPIDGERPISTVQITKEPGQLTIIGVPKGHELEFVAVSKKKAPSPKWKEVSNTAWAEIFFVCHIPKNTPLEECHLHIGTAGSLYEMRVKDAYYDEKGALRIIYVDDFLDEEGLLYIPQDDDEEDLPPANKHFGYTGGIELIDLTTSYFDLSLETVKPSDFDTSEQFCQVCGQFEQELVARKLIMMMKQTGDQWRPFDIESYQKHYEGKTDDYDLEGFEWLIKAGRLEWQKSPEGAVLAITDQLIEDLEKYIIK